MSALIVHGYVCLMETGATGTHALAWQWCANSLIYTHIHSHFKGAKARGEQPGGQLTETAHF